MGAMFGLSTLLATGGSGEGGVGWPGGWPGFEMESRSACRFSFSFMSSGRLEYSCHFSLSSCFFCRELIGGFEVLPGELPLFRCQFSPCLHLPLNAALLFRRHGRKPSGNTQPFLLAEERQRIPVAAQWRKNNFLLYRQFAPYRLRWSCNKRRAGRFRPARGRKKKTENYSNAPRFNHALKPLSVNALIGRSSASKALSMSPSSVTR